jgi:hypothetical protein
MAPNAKQNPSPSVSSRAAIAIGGPVRLVLDSSVLEPSTSTGAGGSREPTNAGFHGSGGQQHIGQPG